MDQRVFHGNTGHSKRAPRDARDLQSGVYELREVDAGASSGKSMLIPVTVGGTRTKTLVDLGSQITVLSQEFYDSCRCRYPLGEKARLNTAAKDQPMVACKLKGVKLTFGPYSYRCDAYVAVRNCYLRHGLPVRSGSGQS